MADSPARSRSTDRRPPADSPRRKKLKQKEWDTHRVALTNQVNETVAGQLRTFRHDFQSEMLANMQRLMQNSFDDFEKNCHSAFGQQIAE